jgi:predicted ATP-grasp superfamily ATP-dependent carboligase
MIVEVNGPHHFATDGIFNVDTKYKQASLIKLGYKVINVNYYDWNKLKSDNEKIIFLQNLLNIDSKVANQAISVLRATAKPFAPRFAIRQT